MKKALIASLLGIALNVTTSHGQGFIVMESYKLVGGTTPAFSAVSYSTLPAANTGAKAGQFVGAAQGWKADLLFSLNGGTSYTLAAGSQTGFFAGSADGGSPITDGAGVFVGPTVTIPGYTSGAVLFKVEAFNGTSFSSANTTFNGTSAAFSIPSLETNPLLPPGSIMNLSGTTVNGIQSFTVAAVPEPTVFALAGIGAAALMIVRRKK